MDMLGDDESPPQFRCCELGIKSEKDQSIKKEYKHGIVKDWKQKPNYQVKKQTTKSRIQPPQGWTRCISGSNGQNDSHRKPTPFSSK